MKKIVLIESQYFPCIDYFALITKCDIIIIETKENYQKQTARNRCYIRGANRIERLSIPIVKSVSTKTPSTKALVADHQSSKWRKEHWRAIQSAYSNAPFFEFYAELIHKALFQDGNKLFDLNMRLLNVILHILNISIPVQYSKRYEKITSKNIMDARDKLHHNKPCCANYPSYFQIFGDYFTPNLSILDLIFCEGNQASDYLKNLRPTLENRR